VVHGNYHLTVQEVAHEVSISIGSCHQIFTEKLQMHRVSAKFMLHLLTDDQKENCVEISQELLASANSPDLAPADFFLFPILNTLGTGDADLCHLRFCVINVKDG
jgi:hypothetical protein